MITYPHRIRLQRGHLVHLARSTRGGLTITQLTTACGHTYEVRGIADLRAEGTLCRGCRIAAQEGADAFPVIGSTSPARKGGAA
ncbi:hypothetical protein DEJ49_33260 [Streptomyces venezuelae]|uniref:Uncharacterized protein n=1 Tax=Streptomyces venezuelae TaxID=54571 RepID=A0A5P2CSE2_STRVZ|nr:hypothetical protein [Streptomyces venezuelae]QES45210.1 hypothetical protein DEJ49_33260 [Streptomyces venezuelae]